MRSSFKNTLLLAGLISCSHFAFANPMGTPVLSLSASPNPASVTSTGTTSVVWTVYNNANATVSNITMSKLNNQGSTAGLSITAHTCSNLAGHSSCTFTMSISGPGNSGGIPGAEKIAPVVCMAGGQACFQPAAANWLQVNVSQASGAAYFLSVIGSGGAPVAVNQSGTMTAGNATSSITPGPSVVSTDGTLMYYAYTSNQVGYVSCASTSSLNTGECTPNSSGVFQFNYLSLAPNSSTSGTSYIWGSTNNTPYPEIESMTLNNGQLVPGGNSKDLLYLFYSLSAIAAENDNGVYVSGLNLNIAPSLQYCNQTITCSDITPGSWSTTETPSAMVYKNISGQGYLYISFYNSSHDAFLQVCSVSGSTVSDCSNITQIGDVSGAELPLAVSSDGTTAYILGNNSTNVGTATVTLGATPSLSASGTPVSVSNLSGPVSLALSHDNNVLFVLDTNGSNLDIIQNGVATDKTLTSPYTMPATLKMENFAY